MNLRRVLFIAACLLPATAAPAAAQAPWPQAGQPTQAAPSPWTQAGPPAQAPISPWTQQPQRQPDEPPCFKEFVKLRDDAQKKASAIQGASKRKPSAREACNLFTTFSNAEAKLVKYAGANAASCGIPPQIIDGMKQQHAKTNGIRTNICNAAAAQQQQRPAGPSLSDALSAPIPNSNNIKTGRGTYDTLTGSPLGK